MNQSIDIIPELRAHIAKKYITRTNAAKAWGVSTAFVSAVLNGKKVSTQAMLADSGFQRIVEVRYVRLEFPEA